MTIEESTVIWKKRETSPEEYGQKLGKLIVDWYFENYNVDKVTFETEEQIQSTAIEMIQYIADALGINEYITIKK